VVTVYKSVAGVTDAAADTEKATVTISYNPKKTDEETLLKALKDKPKYKLSRQEKGIKK